MFFDVYGTIGAIFLDVKGSNWTIPFSYLHGDLTFMTLFGDASFAIAYNKAERILISKNKMELRENNLRGG